LRFVPINQSMSKKKVLIIAQEMEPYTEGSLLAQLANKLPLYLNTNDCEIRILMPRFGSVNERRHRLHEVVRLSGMNIIVNDDDYPLIIKVASLPGSRIQVYFLDNDDFFKRKFLFENEEGVEFADNLERSVFFSKGAIETVRKFGWAPEIIHCHGWFTALIPLYIRTAYKQDPVFQNSKIIYSLVKDQPTNITFEALRTKALINNIDPIIMLDAKTDSGTDLHRAAIKNSDGIIFVEGDLPEQYYQYVETFGKKKLDAPVTENFGKDYLNFYELLMAENISE